MDSKNVIIYVAGQRYSIRTKDTEEYVISTGEQVDLRIKGIQNDNPRLNRDACAILAALISTKQSPRFVYRSRE